MQHLCEEKRKDLLRLLDIAQQRLTSVREVVTTANDDFAGSAIRIAIDTAIVPLRIAFEDAEGI